MHAHNQDVLPISAPATLAASPKMIITHNSYTMLKLILHPTPPLGEYFAPHMPP